MSLLFLGIQNSKSMIPPVPFGSKLIVLKDEKTCLCVTVTGSCLALFKLHYYIVLILIQKSVYGVCYFVFSLRSEVS